MTQHRFAFRIFLSAVSLLASLPLAAQIQVQGRVKWVDRRGPGEPGSAHPARGVLIEICDTRLAPGAQVVATTNTNESGQYNATVETPAGSLRDILVRARSQAPAATVQAVGTTLPYILPSAAFSAQPANAVVTADIGGNFAKTNNAAFSVLDAIVGARQYVSKMSHTDLAPVPVEFPAPGSASYFQSGQLHILLGDRWDWDVIMHEYGHYVSRCFDLDNSPGGTHYFNENIGDRLPKSDAIRLAWGEGWPTFFAILAQKEMGMASYGIPYVGDPIYSDTEDASIDIDLSASEGSMGEDNEVSIMRLLYQAVIESTGTHLSGASLWQVLVSAKPPHLSPAYSAMIAQLDTQAVASVGSIATRHRIAPGPSEPATGPSLPETPPVFNWAANGGGGLHHNNRFTLRFLARDLTLLWESAPIVSGTNYQPTADEWGALRAKNVFYWLVAGFDSDDPATGPYLSSMLNMLPASTGDGSHQ